MPFANEHSARLRNPKDFDEDSFRRTKGGKLFNRIDVPKTIAIIWAKLKGKAKPKDPVLPQALRFPIKNWTVSQARKWLKDNKVKFILFEPATGKTKAVDTMVDFWDGIVIKEMTFEELSNQETIETSEEVIMGKENVSADTNRPFYYATSLKDVTFLTHGDDHLAKIELLPVGKWRHPFAPDGEMVVTTKLLAEYIKNFKDSVVGSKLPLDIDHWMDSRTTPGWIVDMKIETDDRGRRAIFATLNITDPAARQRIQDGSLEFISPEIWTNWQNPDLKEGGTFNLIRAAALTNYPFLKNMNKIEVLNFSEIQKERGDNMTEEERLEAEKKAAEDKAAADKAAEEKAIADKAEADKVAAEKATEETKAAEEKAAAEKAEADKIAADKVADEAKAADDKAAAEKVAAEVKAAEEKAAAEAIKAKENKTTKPPKFDATKASKEELQARLTEAKTEIDKRDGVDKDKEAALFAEKKGKLKVKLDEFIKDGRMSPAAHEVVMANDALIRLSDGKEGDALVKVLSMNKTQIQFAELTVKGVESEDQKEYLLMNKEEKAKFLLAKAVEENKKTGQPINDIIHKLAAKYEEEVE